VNNTNEILLQFEYFLQFISKYGWFNLADKVSEFSVIIQTLVSLLCDSNLSLNSFYAMVCASLERNFLENEDIDSL
jgi:hypothetical protein